MGALLLATARAAFTPPWPWLRDAIVQFSLYARRTLVPLTLSMVAFTVGYSIFFFLAFLDAVGAVDRQPGGGFIAMVRVTAVWISTMIFAGVAGSYVCADLGARKIRDELDALSVLGVDRIRSLVAPRVVAMTALAPLIGLIGLFAAMTSTYLVTPSLSGFSRAVFRDSIAHSVIPADLIAFEFKLLIVGLFVGVVSCYKGLSSSGGTEGVGRAVNETVVVTFFGIWLINSLFNLGYLTLFPDSSVLRG
jgi:phospholipid/cholesterol/gamma-HCH transport system permease protein